jgi:cytochrome c-type biogenesis protein
MAQYLEAFLLGNAAILGNVCVLPLYPGLLAFLAGRDGAGARGGAWLGAVVLAGVLSLMVATGLILFALRQSVASFLPVLLPLAYGAVLILGVLLLLGQNPFKRLASAQAPVLRNPYATAYLYGLLLGPMTLPCTGPLIVSAFVLGAGDAVALADGLIYFLAFGLGFGWPLVALSLVAASTGRRLTGWFARREPVIQRLSGVLLVGIALFGLWVDVLPNLSTS